jgi:HAD superfamily hydrolase (TIGR01509 family)
LIAEDESAEASATVTGVPTYRACLVDVFDTAISIDLATYSAALAGQAGVDPDAFVAAFRAWAVPAMEGRASIRQALAGVLRSCGVSADERMLDGLLAADRDLVGELAVLHGDVVPFLESLRELGVRTAFVSNCGENTRPLLDRLGLTVLVDELVLSCEVRVAKPDPAIFEAAVGRLGVSAGESLFVDDQLAFCRAAEAAGIRAVQIDRAGGPGAVSTLSELLAYL